MIITDMVQPGEKSVNVPVFVVAAQSHSTLYTSPNDVIKMTYMKCIVVMIFLSIVDFFILSFLALFLTTDDFSLNIYIYIYILTIKRLSNIYIF